MAGKGCSRPDVRGGGGCSPRRKSTRLPRCACSQRRSTPQRGVVPEGGVPDPSPNGNLRIGTYRDLWAGEVTEKNPALRFLEPKQTLEVSPTDAEKLGVAHGQEVVVSSNGTSLQARVAIRERIRPGGAFLIEGIAKANANALAAGAANCGEAG